MKRRVLMRKYLNISSGSDYSADTDESDLDVDPEEFYKWRRESRFWGGNTSNKFENDLTNALPKLRRRKSETLRAQYIHKKEIRVCVGTWNVGGKHPKEDLDIQSWLDINDPADIYVIGLQEIIPLNAGNVFGAEDSSPIPKWENIIRETLNRIPPAKTKFKCYSDPPSPSRFKPSDDALNLEDKIVQASDSDDEVEIHPSDEESNGCDEVGNISIAGQNVLKSEPLVFGCRETSFFPGRLEKSNCPRTEDYARNSEASFLQHNSKLIESLSGSERLGLSSPEPPLDLLGKQGCYRTNAFKSPGSFKSSKSFVTPNPFKLSVARNNRVQVEAALLAKLDLESLIHKKQKPPFVRIISKQMVGIFLTIWVRRSLRRHVQNLKVSTVGVGAMGYIGNKGSISVSMSIYQTPFCFICSHLTSGEKDIDAIKRNADVNEIHQRTQFHSLSTIGLPKSIHDHERIIWLGDLNYRINLSYERAQELISKEEWSKLVEFDQLMQELKNGRAFDGWCEGRLNFPPTYKYELNSEKYYGEDLKDGRRTPAWCDRILSFGKGMRLLSYRRTELKLSDHRPVTASYMVEVEVFCPWKLKRALTITDAEIKN
ncbi:Inositol-polyphosphate 5-phosphatase [Bertholletia excelsa]